MRANPRILHQFQRYDELGRLPGISPGMRCPNGIDLRRRTVNLPKNRRYGSRAVGPASHCIFMHKWRFDEEKTQGLPCWNVSFRDGPQLKKLLENELISEADIAFIRNRKSSSSVVIAPSKWMYWNVHVDGLENTHDRIVEREGVFKECVKAIRLAKSLGFQVATNTTVYRETEVREIEAMFEFFSALGVDGHTISPGYDFDAAKEHIAKQTGKTPEEFFLTRETTRHKFANIQAWGRRFTILGTPVYQEFLAGKRELTCTAWAIPTRNIKGWKAPCYLITDGHYPSYDKMLQNVDWAKYGVADGVVRDDRCKNCMVHCGYDPSGALGTNFKPGDLWKNICYNFGSKPKHRCEFPR